MLRKEDVVPYIKIFSPVFIKISIVYLIRDKISSKDIKYENKSFPIIVQKIQSTRWRNIKISKYLSVCKIKIDPRPIIQFHRARFHRKQMLAFRRNPSPNPGQNWTERNISGNLSGFIKRNITKWSNGTSSTPILHALMKRGIEAEYGCSGKILLKYSPLLSNPPFSFRAVPHSPRKSH